MENKQCIIEVTEKLKMETEASPYESYVGALVEVVGELKDAYGHLDEAWEKDTEKFLKVMILDGCFILETMWADQSEDDVYPGDIVFSCHGKRNVIPCIKRDMLLLENQVPLLVLQKLLAVYKTIFIDAHPQP